MTSASFAKPGFAHADTTDTVDELSTVLTPYRVVIGSVLASMFWKARYYPEIVSAYSGFHLQDEFFPGFFSSPYVLAALFLVSAAAGTFSLFTRNRIAMRVQAIVMMICLFGLCIHQGAYNDVTFLTCFWVSAWCVWFTMRINDPVEKLMRNAKTFAVLIISLIFLGGAAGKLTPGYWSGQVLYEIYFINRDFWLFNLLRAQLETETLREVATYYSRFVIVAETACGFLWLLPPKLACSIGLVMFLGITLFSNLNLFSVTLCLIGLMLFGLHETKRE